MGKRDIIRQAVIEMVSGEVGATGIKVELEAQFNRTDRGGNHTCERCDECEGGTFTCDTCEGSGETFNDEYEEYDTCYECDGEGRTTCSNCDGHGHLNCSCDTYDFESTAVCHDFILKRLVPLGLAEPTNEPLVVNGSIIAYQYRPKFPLVFSKFYRDGSVDSEWTFTLSTEVPDAVFKLPKMIEIFVELGLANGNGIDVHGAGMHIAILQGEGARYPVDIPDEQLARFYNFKRSATLLIPALYFLGTSNEISRGLSFRVPRISRHDKYSTVYYRGGAIEYRVFDTCYDNPSTILDNIVVIANSLKLWKEVPVELNAPTKRFKFGSDKDNTIKRFYNTVEHIDLLNFGLNYLKPAYIGIRKLKKQRKFDLKKRDAQKLVPTLKKEAEGLYAEYDNRFEWRMRYEFYEIASRKIQCDSTTSTTDAEIYAAERVKAMREQSKLSKPKFIEKRSQELLTELQGNYELCAD